MSDEKPLENLRKKAHQEFDDIFSSLVKANSAGIAGCIALIAQEIHVATPLICFLIGALGYGMIKLSRLFYFNEVWHYYLNSPDELKEWNVNLPSSLVYKGKPNKSSVEKFCMKSAYILDSIGRILLVLFFFIGVISSVLAVILM